MANEAAGGCTGVKVPQTQCVVPGRRECELAIRRDNDVGYEVVVAVENSFRVSVRVIVAGQLPDNDSFV